MVIGKGLIASTFEEYKNNKQILLFASGISDSTCKEPKEFLREEKLLYKYIQKQNNKLLIYFSSCSLDDPSINSNPYHLHKKNMESLIISNAKKYIIFRAPSIIAKKGSPTLIINYLMNKILNNEPFEIWENATRNIIDIDDLYKIISYIIDNKLFQNETVNVAYPKNLTILEIVYALESTFKKKANYKLIDKGIDYEINISKIKPIFNTLQIIQPPLKTLIRKNKV